MFKKLFFYLLNHYSKTEKNRLKILKVLNKNMCDEYNEQTRFGNVYNFYIEFIMSNDFITEQVRNKDMNNLNILRRGINDTFVEAVNFIEREQL